MKRWRMIHKIKAMYDEGNGYSLRQIARELSISRNTARRYIKMSEEEITGKIKEVEREKVLDKYKGYIAHLLQKYPKLTAVKIKRKLENKGVCEDISERTTRRYVSKLKKETLVKQERYYEPVIDMVAGVQCQIDIGEKDVIIRGKVTTVYFGVFVLSYSRLMYVSVSDKPINTKRFIKMHDEAFTYFDGVVEECVYDQTKLVAIKEEYREVWFNEKFHQYATIARFDIRVCEGYDPESKGKVESGVKYVKNNFFYGEELTSFDELKKEILNWLEETANIRIHGTTKKIPKELYETKEYKKMKPYLSPSFIGKEDKGDQRGVDKTSLISHKSNKYSVPMEYQSSTVNIKEEGRKLIILDNESKDVIATHDIYEGKGKIIKNTNHYRDHQKLITDREKEVAEIIGNELSNKFCKTIKVTSPKIYKDQLVGFIRLLRQYANKENLKEVLNSLSERPRLTVSFIRDYIPAYYSNTDAGIKKESSERPSSILKAYGYLSSQTVKEGNHYDQF